MVGSHLSEDPSLPRLPPPPALPWPAPDTQIPLAGWGRSIQVSLGCSQLTLPGFYPSPSKWPFQATGTLFGRASDGPRGELTMPLKGSGGRGRFFPPSLFPPSFSPSLPSVVTEMGSQRGGQTGGGGMAQIRGWPGPAQCPLSLSHAGSPAEARAAAPAKTPSCDLRRLVEEQGLEGTVSATVYERPKSCQSPPWEGVGARRCLPGDECLIVSR